MGSGASPGRYLGDGAGPAGCACPSEVRAVRMPDRMNAAARSVLLIARRVTHERMM